MTSKYTNKGFTLVELISVIVIMGILLLVAVPGIFGISKTVKDNMYCAKINNFEEAAKLYGQDYVDEINETGFLEVDVKTLIENNLYKKEIDNCIYDTDDNHDNDDNACVKDPRNDYSMDGDMITVVNKGNRFAAYYKYMQDEDRKLCEGKKEKDVYGSAEVTLIQNGATREGKKSVTAIYLHHLPTLVGDDIPEKKYVVKFVIDSNLCSKKIDPVTKNYAFQGYFYTPAENSKKYYNADGTSANIYDIVVDYHYLYAKFSNEKFKINPITDGINSKYYFYGWGYQENNYDSQVSGETSTEINLDNYKSYMKNNTLTLYALFKRKSVQLTLNHNNATYADKDYVMANYDEKLENITIPKREYTVTFNANGGTLPSDKKVLTSKYKFDGYFENENINSTKYYNSDGTSDYVSYLTEPKTIIAHWSEGGITLPTATRNGYKITGWYTAASGGSLVKGANETYYPTSNITLYAHWTPSDYAVTISTDSFLRSSSSSVSVKYASSNTVTITPSTGYYLKSVTCTNGYTTNASVGFDSDRAQLIRIYNNSNNSSAICTFTSAPKNVVYVSASGNDTTGTGSMSKPYATLSKAYSSLPGDGTITLLSNISSTSRLYASSNKNVTINSNSGTYTVSRNSSLTSNIIYVSQGTITINNVNIDASTASHNNTAIVVSANGTLKYNGGTLTENSSNGINSHGKVEIVGSTIINGSGLNYPSIYIHEDGTLNINGGKVSSSQSNAIYTKGTTKIIGNSNVSSTASSTNALYVDSLGNLSINGGSFTSSGSVIRNNGSLNINGGSIIGTGVSAAIYNNSGSGTTTISNANIQSTNGTAIINSSGTLNILNVTLNSYDNGIYSYGTLNIDGNTKVTGSRCHYDPSQASDPSVSQDDDDYQSGNVCSSGVNVVEGVATINSGVYNTSGFAVNVGVKSTVYLKGGSYSSSSNIVSNAGIMYVSNNANIVNSSGGYPSLYNRETGTTYISSGTVSSTNANSISNYGKLFISGTARVVTSANNPAIHNKKYGVIDVSGGTISSVSNAIYNKRAYGRVTITGGSLSSSSSNTINNNGILDINAPITLYGVSSAAVISNSSSGNTTLSRVTIKSSTAAAVSNSGTLRINSGVNLSSESSSTVTLFNSNGATCVINDGRIYSKYGNAINNYGNIKIDGPVSVIADSTYPTIYNQNSGYLTISAGTYINNAGRYAIYNNAGACSVSNASITGLTNT